MKNITKKRVGIPRALLYYKFGEMWTTFFNELGAEVVISPPTTKSIKETAVSKAPEEDCYSTKLYFGHALELKDKVDYLFIPRFGGRKKNQVGCPKFIGLAEVFRSMFPDAPEILMPHYNRGMDGHTRAGLVFRAYRLGGKFTKNPLRRIRAIIKAFIAHRRQLKELILSEATFKQWVNSEIVVNEYSLEDKEDHPVKIALVGHSYTLNDPFSSSNIKKLLQEQGADLITSEQMPRSLIEKQMKSMKYDMYFDFEREILGTVMHFLESREVNGIIHIMVFSCGPDSIAGEMATRYSRRSPDVPMLQLVFDELTGEAGMRTRIEAFVDMLKRSMAKNIHPTMTNVHI